MKLLWAAALSVLLIGTAEANDWKRVRIATEGAYPPWNAVDASGTLAGFEIELGAELCRRMAVDCEFVAQDWEGIIPALQQGKFDAIMAAMSITEERLRAIAFTAPYAAEPSALLAAKDGPLAALGANERTIDTSADSPAVREVVGRLAGALRGRAVGVQISTVQGVFLAHHLPEVAVRAYPTFEAASLDLAAGRVDALLAVRSAVELVAKRDARFGLVGPSLQGGDLGRGVGVGLRKGDADLKAMFDRAIAAATADGAVRRLALKHFGFDVSIQP